MGHQDESGRNGGEPSAPRPVHGGVDTTLGGYLREHRRPPAFEGLDGAPYTVALEVEKTPNLAAPFEGYLVFPRWADSGLGVVGHLETPTLTTERSREAALEWLGALTLGRVKALLDEAVRTRASRESPAGPSHSDPPESGEASA